ncbi:MAG: ImmA/IrrE family metallo-endopeptidase [Ignavibacteriae bacterium]|nr:ImmA/IrrE family metallo-endopeptidase [Ignavibacteriota bacterium]
MEVIAKANARKLISEYCIEKPEELNLLNILSGERILLERKELKNSLANIVFDNEDAIITIGNNFADEGHENFVIAHELGHFLNQRNIKGNINCNTLNLINVKAEIDFEYSANVFASELIMHEPWFIEFTKGKKLSSDLLSNIAEYFKTSLSSAAMRYAELGKTPTAIVFSKDGIIKWSRINSYFPFKFIKGGIQVNNLSYASEFYKGNNLPDKEEVILADAWFKYDYYFKKDFFLMEQNIPMPNYNSVLTILWEKA